MACCKRCRYNSSCKDWAPLSGVDKSKADKDQREFDRVQGIMIMVYEFLVKMGKRNEEIEKVIPEFCYDRWSVWRKVLSWLEDYGVSPLGK